MMEYVAITPRQASELANRRWTIDGTTYHFAAELSSGGEAFLYPLVDDKKKTIAYLRFLQQQYASPARIERTSWLISQQWPSVSTVFLGAPFAWASTMEDGRPEGFGHDFTATLHHAVPGISWAALKKAVDRGKRPLPLLKTRIAFAKSLVAQFATLESLGFTHGDPSDGNMLVDSRTGEVGLIDFDSFVTRSQNLPCPTLPVGEGGIKGTPGYMPPDLELNSTPSATPYSDRFGRDMLLLELLGIQPGDPADASPATWDHQQLLLASVRPVAEKLRLPHLMDASVFSAPENNRPSSKQLALDLNCRMPSVAVSKPRQSFWRSLFDLLTPPAQACPQAPLQQGGRHAC